MYDPKQIIEDDKSFVWHPYSSTHNPTDNYPVVSANGVRLQLADGRQLIDGMASWWSAIHGYNHPTLNQAVNKQIEDMSHVMFGGLTHPQAVSLCKTLVEITPKDLDKVFLADSGSVSVEVAIKMALQYWLSQGIKSKTKLLSLRNGYHGDTFGAMSLCDPITGMHHLFEHSMPQHLFAEAPTMGFDTAFDERHIADLKRQLSEQHQQIAAVIVEPIVQGAGGMRFYSPDYLKRIRELCDEFNVLLIADEIATGFGRTGKLFACEHANISPDILCLGKAITGGYMTLAATLCSNKVARGICDGEAGVLMHGPTFMGNPLACAVANASIQLLLDSPWQQTIKRIEQQLLRELSPAKALTQVDSVRVLGAIGVIEMKEAVVMTELTPKFVDAGIWVRPFGKLIYIMPPYIISSEDLSLLTSRLVNVITTS
ncbi:adenosylmethionine-8-amino-7-oxononanoate aminotransferase [Sinobacterium caligoides]|uniref:Adenosylmethionine-8-amino-7-oxononanoate aminotransferase n=1 Tax=Sinobacterium caligoides TaxID=933926 RepID=A0A3N2DYB5_9GAMM|nr:adenosylmethionine--8-amino-7-oxononanoate transaminase [Sinobacterium caligoides]ROS04767.1 adenosylmethionine-8-amino-7-oxononanoate aminotransferase [Sinobacterium caligoides]